MAPVIAAKPSTEKDQLIKDVHNNAQDQSASTIDADGLIEPAAMRGVGLFEAAAHRRRQHRFLAVPVEAHVGDHKLVDDLAGGHSVPEVGYDGFADGCFEGFGLIVDFDPHAGTKASSDLTRRRRGSGNSVCLRASFFAVRRDCLGFLVAQAVNRAKSRKGP